MIIKIYCEKIPLRKWKNIHNINEYFLFLFKFLSVINTNINSYLLVSTAFWYVLTALTFLMFVYGFPEKTKVHFSCGPLYKCKHRVIIVGSKTWTARISGWNICFLAFYLFCSFNFAHYISFNMNPIINSRSRSYISHCRFIYTLTHVFYTLKIFYLYAQSTFVLHVYELRIIIVFVFISICI